MSDPLSSFVKESHTAQKGKRTSLKMRKEQSGAGFCLKASGSPAAIKRLAEIMNGIDLTEHQLTED
jgi:hypothetical protein